jgi:hypothetical protein
VLVWINGPFGGGKTVTAFELVRRVEGAVVCDPEEVGFGLRRAMPREVWGDDFQDLRSWRAGVVEVLDLTLRGVAGPVIVPMTLVAPAYVDEVLGGLRALGHEVRHVALVSSPEEVRRRLAGRGVPGLKRDLWALAQVDRCLEALTQPGFAEQVDTTHRSVAEVADAVAALVGLPIAASTDGPVRGWLRRTGTSLRHIRLR